MTLQELYNIAKPIPEELALTNKYTFAGFHNLIEVRIIDVNDIIGKETPINTYLSTNYKTLIFPNIVNGEIVDVFLRPLEVQNKPLKIGSKTFPFGIQYLNEGFKYGDIIILVEGVGDLAGLRLLDSSLNIISMQTSAVGVEHLGFLASLTNKILLLGDNDEVGKASRNKIIGAFKQVGVTVIPLEQHMFLKDTGDVLEMALNFTKTGNEVIGERLQELSEYYLTLISVNKF